LYDPCHIEFFFKLIRNNNTCPPTSGRCLQLLAEVCTGIKAGCTSSAVGTKIKTELLF
jgi:hypothetical protein